MTVKWAISQFYLLSFLKDLSQLSKHLRTFPYLTVFSKTVKILTVQHFLFQFWFLIEIIENTHFFLPTMSRLWRDYTVSGLNCQFVLAQARKWKVLFGVWKNSPFNKKSWWSLKIAGSGGEKEGKDKIKSQKCTSTNNVQGIFDRNV